MQVAVRGRHRQRVVAEEVGVGRIVQAGERVVDVRHKPADHDLRRAVPRHPRRAGRRHGQHAETHRQHGRQRVIINVGDRDAADRQRRILVGDLLARHCVDRRVVHGGHRDRDLVGVAQRPVAGHHGQRVFAEEVGVRRVGQPVERGVDLGLGARDGDVRRAVAAHGGGPAVIHAQHALRDAQRRGQRVAVHVEHRHRLGAGEGQRAVLGHGCGCGRGVDRRVVDVGDVHVHRRRQRAHVVRPLDGVEHRRRLAEEVCFGLEEQEVAAVGADRGDGPHALPRHGADLAAGVVGAFQHDRVGLDRHVRSVDHAVVVEVAVVGQQVHEGGQVLDADAGVVGGEEHVPVLIAEAQRLDAGQRVGPLVAVGRVEIGYGDGPVAGHAEVSEGACIDGDVVPAAADDGVVAAAALQDVIRRTEVVANKTVVSVRAGDRVGPGAAEIDQRAVRVVEIARIVAEDQAGVGIERAVARQRGVAGRAEVELHGAAQVAGVEVGIDVLEAVVRDRGQRAGGRRANRDAGARIDEAVAGDGGGGVVVVFKVDAGPRVAEAVVVDRQGVRAAV